ncbi:hypothetical protein TNCV_5132541 [Trichonephila clavipes]|nr:hypothetical protein TNCV_5132541 [Trichonephila clavipes]
MDCGTSCVTCCAVLLEPQLLDIMIVQFRDEKVSNHGSIPITIDCNVVAFIILKKDSPAHKAHQTVSFSGFSNAGWRGGTSDGKVGGGAKLRNETSDNHMRTVVLAGSRSAQRKFREGRESVNDDDHSRHLSTSQTDNSEQKSREVLAKDQ